MATKLTEKKAGGKRLGFMALVFSLVFFTSSLEVYQDDKAVRRARAESYAAAAVMFHELAHASESAVLINLLGMKSSESDRYRYISYTGGGRGRVQSGADYSKFVELYSLSSHADHSELAELYLTSSAGDGSGRGEAFFTLNYEDYPSIDADTLRRVYVFNSNYEKALALYASALRVETSESMTSVFSPDGRQLIYTRSNSGSIEDYSYARLSLESRRQKEHLSWREYQNCVDLLSLEYAKKLPLSELLDNERRLKSQLENAERQMAGMQARVDSLEKQLKQAERTPLEQWLPFITIFLSLLGALSSHFIWWRADRRSSREAELLPLKRRDLEQNITQKEQQLREEGGRIIIPTLQEFQHYSSLVEGDDLKRK